MISIIQNQDKYEIRFPYDAALVEHVKNVPGRSWSPEAKMWTIPKARLGFFLAQVKGTQYESQVVIQSDEDLDVNANIDKTNVVPDIDISDAKLYVEEGKKLYAHQIDTLKFSKWRSENGLTSGFILADQPGSGKTLSVCNVALYMKKKYKIKHCLIIACVNSAKYNWVEDIKKHTNGEHVPYILGSRRRKDGTISYNGSGADKEKDLTSMKMYGKEDKLPFFLIMNIEAVRTKKGREYTVANLLIDKINKGQIGLIALDEIHKNTSMTSHQGKQLLRIKKNTQGANVQWIPMTGTPITSRPTDVFLPLRLIEGHKSDSYYKWCQEYCVYGGFGGHEIMGYKNMPKLKNLLQPNMLRRLKEDILDLPPKLHFTEYVENTDYQNKLYKAIAEDIALHKDEIAHSLNPMTKLLRLRQVNGSPELVDTELIVDNTYLSKNARLSRLLELVEEIVERDEKVVIFSNWVEPLRTLYRFVKEKYPTCCYTGTMSQEDREKHKHAFINDPKYKVMLGTVGALGTSHTLTVARNVIFYDCPWNPADIEQCEDRCHRPGTSSSVNVYTLVTKDTIDERVHELLSKKEGTAKYIVDNNLDIRSHPELLDLILDIK